jgi:hypothetical protein
MALAELSPFVPLDHPTLDRFYIPGRGVFQGLEIRASEFPPLAAWLHEHCCRSRRSAEESVEAAKQSIANGGWCDRCGNAAGYFLSVWTWAFWESSGVTFKILTDAWACNPIPADGASDAASPSASMTA